MKSRLVDETRESLIINVNNESDDNNLNFEKEWEFSITEIN